MINVIEVRNMLFISDFHYTKKNYFYLTYNFFKAILMIKYHNSKLNHNFKLVCEIRKLNNLIYQILGLNEKYYFIFFLLIYHSVFFYLFF